MTVAGTIKNNKKFLVLQNTQLCLASLSSFMVGGYTGAIIDVISIIRNTLCYKEKLTPARKGIIILFQIIFSILLNDAGFIGLCPMFGVLFYTVFMKNDAKTLKVVTAITLVFWAVYEFYIQLYTAAIFDIIGVISNLVGLYRVTKNKNFKESENCLNEG